MKTKFSGLPARTVTLTHGEQSLTLTLRPLPIAYGEAIEAVMPKPTIVGNGRPIDDPKRMPAWETRRLMLMLAKSMDVIEAKAPEASAGGPAWEAYADTIKAEFEAACFVEGDLTALATELSQLNRGLGTLGNG